MKHLLIVLLLIQIIQAKTLWVLNNDISIGNVCIEINDIVILPYDSTISIPRNIEVIRCNGQKCVDQTIEKYTHMYRTYGLNVEIVW